MKKIGLQLYTVREYLNSDETIKNLFARIKSMGYTEVESFGAIENMETPSRIANETGLAISGTISNFKAKERGRKNEIIQSGKKILNNYFGNGNGRLCCQ